MLASLCCFVLFEFELDVWAAPDWLTSTTGKQPKLAHANEEIPE